MTASIRGDLKHLATVISLRETLANALHNPPSRPTFAIFLIICVLAMGRAGWAQYRATQWTADTGLPQNSVRGVTQGRDGYMWIATLNGVAKFDGVRFTTFNKGNTPGISSSRFVAMVAGDESDLWLPSEDGNLTRFHENHFQTIGPGAGITQRSVAAITSNRKGGVWVLSADKVLRWVGERSRFEVETFSRPDLHFAPLWWVGTGFWATDGNRLICFAHGTLNNYSLPKEVTPSGIRGIAVGSDGTVWLGLRDGRLGRLLGGVFRPENGAISTRFKDPNRPGWAVQISQNFARTLSFPSGGVDRDVTYNVIATDTEGDAWVGSEGEGLFRIQKQSIQSLSSAQGLASDNVYPILKSSSGEMWVGSWPAGLSRVHGGELTAFKPKDGIPGLVSSLYEDRQGRIWIGTHNGMRIFSKGRFIVPSGLPQENLPAVQAMYQSMDGAMMLGTAKGIYVLSGKNSHWLTTHDGLATDDIRVIVEDHRGDVWIGGYGGITRIHNGMMNRWTENQGLPSNNVRSVVEDSHGEIWVGTYDGGIGWLRDGRWIIFNEARGMFDNGAFQILEDTKERFWISSNRGVYRVSRSQLEAVADGREARVLSIAYGRADGMLSVECNGGLWPAGAKDDRGFLWFPTQKGVAIIDPMSVSALKQPPRVAIENASIEHVLQKEINHVFLRPGQANLEVEYTALTYSRPEQISFRYMLDGIDSTWQNVNHRRTAYYPHLPPGDFVFRVSAQNSDGVDSAADATLLVTVIPPFYRRWWFLIAMCIVAMALITISWHYRVEKLKKEQAAQRAAQQAFSQELIASQEKERRRIAAELHDSLGQRLIIINNLALFLLRAKGKVRSEEDKQQTIEEISVEALQALEETRAISYALRPFQLDRLGLSKAIQGLVKTVSRATGIEMSAEIGSIDDAFPEELRINFFRIVQEALNNMVKHSGATKGFVRAERDRSSIVLEISDNGRGLPTEPRDSTAGPGGFGLTGMRERAAVLQGKLQIKSEPGAGTLVKIEFPCGVHERV